ncbi:MAG TPA: beta-ketoacyl synthase N-terminal-like domain-containing protein [Smithellaceae bacterium]|nr:beta-ketoacyl synthase N-terminal-like domain-containing protein [Smithellaceae bacterium]
MKNGKINRTATMPVRAASFLGPALLPNQDAQWSEALLPLNVDNLVLQIMGQPVRRAGRFIKVVCCGALACLQSVPPEDLQDKKIGIFPATGLGNVDEILPFITQVFKHEGGFPSPNQFANSVSNAAAFFLAKICGVQGVVLTISQEEISFESALWLAQSYLEQGEIELALVGGCDVFTPSVADYRERMNLSAADSRMLPAGEGSSWLLLGGDKEKSLGNILAVDFSNELTAPDCFAANEQILRVCDNFSLRTTINCGLSQQSIRRRLLPGFRLTGALSPIWEQHGWYREDYLPHCGIHPTAAAFGLARALLSVEPALYLHYNCHAAGKLAVVAAAK